MDMMNYLLNSVFNVHGPLDITMLTLVVGPMQLRKLFLMVTHSYYLGFHGFSYVHYIKSLLGDCYSAIIIHRNRNQTYQTVITFPMSPVNA